MSGAEFVELRALSGMVANWIAFMALTRPGDTIMGLRSAHGGHRSVLGSSLAGARGLTFQPIPSAQRQCRLTWRLRPRRWKQSSPGW